MPLWNLYHGHGSLTEADRGVLAAAITDLYAGLPRFYVSVVFQEAPSGSLYVGGEPAESYVRIKVDQMARTLPSAGARARWMSRVNDALTPFMAERNLGWELHIDETALDLWSIQGLQPPPPGSVAERRWARENRPTAYDPQDAAVPTPTPASTAP